MKSQKEIEESFHAGQTRILEMVASDAPLPEILKSVVLLMEAQADGMLCSILLLSADGIHIRHGAAPGLPDEYAARTSPVPPVARITAVLRCFIRASVPSIVEFVRQIIASPGNPALIAASRMTRAVSAIHPAADGCGERTSPDTEGRPERADRGQRRG